jgi:hypothetical protein
MVDPGEPTSGFCRPQLGRPRFPSPSSEFSGLFLDFPGNYPIHARSARMRLRSPRHAGLRKLFDEQISMSEAAHAARAEHGGTVDCGGDACEAVDRAHSQRLAGLRDRRLDLTRPDPRILRRIVPLAPDIAVRIIPDLKLERNKIDFMFPRLCHANGSRRAARRVKVAAWLRSAIAAIVFHPRSSSTRSGSISALR